MGCLFESCYLPAGATHDEKAPYNEPLDVKHKRFVSASISYYDEVELPPMLLRSRLEMLLGRR